MLICKININSFEIKASWNEIIVPLKGFDFVEFALQQKGQQHRGGAKGNVRAAASRLPEFARGGEAVWDASAPRSRSALLGWRSFSGGGRTEVTLESLKIYFSSKMQLGA